MNPIQDVYETPSQAAKRFNVTRRRVLALLAEDRIPGAEYVDGRWFIPKKSWPTESNLGPDPAWLKRKPNR